MRLSDGNIRERLVIGADGQVIGEVTSLFVNGVTWSVEALQVRLRKEIADRLGAARSVFHAGSIEIPVRVIQSLGDAIVLAVGVDSLREVLPGEAEAAHA